MSRNLQVGNRIFEYAIQGTTDGWGEDASAWAQAVTDALATVQGPNDILATSATLLNNQAALVAVAGLAFNTAEVLAIDIDYVITRTYDAGATVVTESGKIKGSFNGTDFKVSIDSEDDSGVRFDITSSGQVQYTSDDKSNHVSSTIRFKAKTIDKP